MSGRLFQIIWLTIVMQLAAIPAQAAWYEASSDHFVIYADDSEKDIRRFAEDLERYHSAMEFLTQHQTGKPSPSNRVTIFVVGSGRDIRKLAGDKSGFVAGFYIPRAGGSKAFVQDIQNKSGYPHFSTVVLLHEYAHHFLLSSSRFAMPRWMSEGAAEFFASASFNRDGSVLIGRPAQHRAYELGTGYAPTVRELLDRDLYRENRGERSDGFYGRSWLLYHYLTFSEERRGQLDRYGREIASGNSSIDAGKAAFGDLDQLEDELKAYLRQRRMLTFSLSPTMLDIGEITLRKLPKGEAEIMRVRIRSQRGVTSAQAKKLVEEAREIAAKHPNDPGVLAVLAETEFDVGNDDAAIAAADRATAINPTLTNPYVQKGYALFRKAADARVPDAAYQAAMAPFSALNARENDHPVPLIYYYRSYAERGLEPPENAKKALERAAELAPFDQRLWLQVAMMQAREGKIELAKQSLRPLAADPHDGRASGLAQNMLKILEAAPDGEAFALSEADAVKLDATRAQAASGGANQGGGSDMTDVAVE